jgi:hypothetical protein
MSTATRQPPGRNRAFPPELLFLVEMMLDR